MEFKPTTESILTVKADGVFLPIMKESDPFPSYFRDLDDAMDGALSSRLEMICFKAEAAQIVAIPTHGKLGIKTVYIVGMGKAEDFTAAVLRKCYAAAARRATAEKSKVVSILYLENDLVEDFFQVSVEGILLAAYTFDEYRSEKNEKDEKTKLSTIQVHHRDKKLTADIKKQWSRAVAIADGTNLARDWVNRSPCHKVPEILAKFCKEQFSKAPFTTKIWGEGEIRKAKMGAFLSVAGGSPNSPRFIHMHYHPSGKSKKCIALVGKGVTFDSGGLSLKPPRYMYDMKCDMSGAAAVIGAFHALAQLKLPIEVHGIIAATENIIGGSSTRPGDVVVARNGKRIEVLNTDAEGRLTLADALDYACELPHVDEVINLATLTGAQLVATGDLVAAAMTNNDAMFARLKHAGELAGEAYWQLPLVEEYKEYIKSDIADIKNTGPEGGAAGCILAGLFLQEFVTCKSWVHLDIAGTAFNSRDLIVSPKGGAGFGVRTLLYYLSSLGE